MGHSLDLEKEGGSNDSSSTFSPGREDNEYASLSLTEFLRTTAPPHLNDHPAFRGNKHSASLLSGAKGPLCGTSPVRVVGSSSGRLDSVEKRKRNPKSVNPKSLSVLPLGNTIQEAGSVATSRAFNISDSGTEKTTAEPIFPLASDSNSSKMCLPLRLSYASHSTGLDNVTEGNSITSEAKISSVVPNKLVKGRAVIPGSARYRDRWARDKARKMLTTLASGKKGSASNKHISSKVHNLSSSEISEASTLKADQRIGDFSNTIEKIQRQTAYLKSLFAEPISSDDLQFSQSLTAISTDSRSTSYGLTSGNSSNHSSNRASQLTARTTTTESGDSFVKTSTSSVYSRPRLGWTLRTTFGRDGRLRRSSTDKGILRGGTELVAAISSKSNRSDKIEIGTMLRVQDQALRVSVGLPPVPILHDGPTSTAHPDHPFTWATVNLWCCSCTNWPSGTQQNQCEICHAYCCVLVDAAEKMRSPDTSMSEKSQAKERYDMIKAAHTFGKDIIKTFSLCCDCNKFVCPKCCNRCELSSCGEIVCVECRPAGRKCEWHGL